MTVTKISKKQIREQNGDSDIERVKSLTDEEIEKAARNDPDSALPTPDQLREFRRRNHDQKNKHQI